MTQIQSVAIKCHQCNKCGKITLDEKKICAKCGGSEIKIISTEGKGNVLDFTTIYFPPDDYKDLAPYSSVLVEFANGLKVFGIVEGELKDVPAGTIATVVTYDEVRGCIVFKLD
jgi:uncharacterized OB-fold protein